MLWIEKIKYKETEHVDITFYLQPVMAQLGHKED